jgi:hypothetical protein
MMGDEDIARLVESFTTIRIKSWDTFWNGGQKEELHRGDIIETPERTREYVEMVPGADLMTFRREEDRIYFLARCRINPVYPSIIQLGPKGYRYEEADSKLKSREL